MKELSIEEKAKRYDKSFERAKEQLNDAKVFDYDNEQIAHDIRTTVYNIFPELKESEDEQHRKWILDYLYDGLRKSDEQFKDHFKAAIAWLEKQGEHQPAWSEEDKGVLLESISVLQSSSHWVLADKLKSLKDRFCCEVNCTTTSEPVVRENKGNYGGISPNSEWNEEDEKMRQETIDWFEKKCFPYALESENPARESIKWLKSLRPHNTWKPSDEQMEILNMVLTNESMDDNIARILRELREQLKKLKG